MEISPTAAGFEPVDLFNGMQGELSRADSSENAVEIGWKFALGGLEINGKYICYRREICRNSPFWILKGSPVVGVVFDKELS
jgi:hypothetical protein